MRPWIRSLSTSRHICLTILQYCVNDSEMLFNELEKRPVGALGADTIVFCARKSSGRGLLGKIFDKLRIQGRLQISKNSSQKALNRVLTL